MFQKIITYNHSQSTNITPFNELIVFLNIKSISKVYMSIIEKKGEIF